MEHQKLLNVLNANYSKFVTRNWNTVNDKSNTNYSVGNKIRYSIEILKSNICDYNDAYIPVRGNITTTGHSATQVPFKNCPPFIKRIAKNDGTIIGDAENLNLVMLMYNLLEYSSIYSDMTDSLWFYSKDKATNFNVDNADINNFKSFNYKPKLLGDNEADGANDTLRNTTIAVPLKYLSNSWQSLEMPLINCKVKLKLKETN